MVERAELGLLTRRQAEEAINREAALSKVRKGALERLGRACGKAYEAGRGDVEVPIEVDGTQG
ncbi:hypothetical protein [Sphaerisporangium dianthi]|uniref:Uncharacterized protein n=1 Tax=Sphaerisporangium dianthi TaxID=1436120 RepID=A0ABV9CIK4_9ACTN